MKVVKTFLLSIDDSCFFGCIVTFFCDSTREKEMFDVVTDTNTKGKKRQATHRKHYETTREDLIKRF